MNKLIEYLAKHHHPGGNAFKIVAVDEVLDESGFTVEEIHEWALEAAKENYVIFSRLRAKGNRWGVDQMISGDIDHVTVTRKGIQWYRDHLVNLS